MAVGLSRSPESSRWQPNSHTDSSKGGKRGPAIVPANAEKSLLYKAVARSGDLQMPPGKPLSAEEIAIIRNWINDGAHWDSAAVAEPGWWSFKKVVRPAVPAN